jgi:GTP pyrophosphokinase
MNQVEHQDFHDNFERALSFATKLHAEQVRKETDIPYISHLISVAGIVLENGGGRDEAIAALLHDSIEDQAETFPGGAEALRNEIKDRFGENVLEIVEGCTDAEVISKPPWKKRKEAYIAHLEATSDATRLVSCSDKLHNARTIVSDLRVIGDSLWSRFKGGKDGTLWYYDTLAKTFMRLGPRKLANELELTVSEMRKLA